MKKLILAIITLISLSITPLFAQENIPQTFGCNTKNYEIKGLSNIQKGQNNEYTILKNNKPLGSTNFKTIKTSLTKNNKTIQKTNSEFISFIANEVGKYEITIQGTDKENCQINLQKEITAHEKIILYLGKENEDLKLGFEDNFKKNNTFFQKTIIKENKIFGEDDLNTQISEQINNIKNSSIIIINLSNFDSFFQILGNANKIDNLNLNKKDIYLTTNLNKHFLKRVLAKYLNSIGLEKIDTINEKDFLNMLSKISFNKSLENDPIITTFSISFQESPKYILISYLVDNLIYNGFPIELIGMILILCVATLVISIFRQVIGFSIFGIYSPLLFGLSMAILNIKLCLLLLAIGLLAKFLTNLLNKKIYLLFNAKLSILVVLYFLLTIVVLGLDKILHTNIINLDIFNNGFIIFPIIFIIIVTDKVFNEGFKVFSLGRRLSFGEFLIVSFSVFGLLNRGRIKHTLLSYPEIIIAVLISHIVIGRFTGLQLLEYFRFMPLIKKHFDSEEE